jgi:membrane-associated phospholipid phosphatase
MVFPIIRDFIILLIVGAITLAHQLDFRVGSNLHIRGWFRGDITNSLPLKPDTVAPGPAAAFAFGYPLVVMIILWFAIDGILTNSFEKNDIEASDVSEALSSVPLLQRAANNNSNTTSLSNPTVGVPDKRNVFNWGQHVSEESTPRSRKCRFALYQFFVLCLGMCFVITVTTAIKLMVARLRPDFIERCKPDYSHPDLVIGLNGWIDGKYAFICTGDEHEIIEGRKSFPSAHSSTALYGGTVAALLLYKRCWNRGTRSVGFIVIPFMIMASIAGGLLIATSRNWDNRHFATDICAGSIIGILCALWTLAFNCYTPSWELDGSLSKVKETPLSTLDV